ncbi:MAG: hypothetical protein MZV64_40760 [Ignavibacteriales bacterium]|nr:hypothetical protein [Ignavibacteriales bacterium]
MEGIAIKDQPTRFEIDLGYTSKAEYVNLFEGSKEISFNKNSEIFSEYTREQFPHVVFSDRIKNLSAQIIGNENDPVQEA